MERRNQNEYKKFIFVEGDDDFHFLCNLLEIEGITDVYVDKINGKSKVKPALKAFTKISAFETAESIAVIVDADASFKDTEKSIAAIFQDLKIPASKNHGETVMNGNTKISFFIMPGNGENGAIENLILKHAETKSIFGHITTLFTELKDNENNIIIHNPDYKYPANDKKAKLQVYLSCNHESDSRIGISMKKKIIDTDDSCFEEIKTYLANI